MTYITKVIELKRDKECKNSVRFVTEDDKSPLSNVYLSRTMAGVNDAKEITITVAIPVP